MMKEIYAIIRPGKDRETKEVLAKLGMMAYTTFRVLGRGEQGGLRYQNDGAPSAKSIPGMKFLSKKLLYLVVDEGLVDIAVEAIIRTNQSGEYGDGKIFVCEIDNAVRIRTAEENVTALW